MIAASAISEKAAVRTAPVRQAKNGKISLQTFLKNYRNREDGFKYEYQDGYVIKSPYTMSDAQRHIAQNLTWHFFQLKFQDKIKGSLDIEKDSFLTQTRYRTPDLVYMSPKDVDLAYKGGHPLPRFVIEIVSPNDLENYYEDKLDAYFDAGVEVVWMIYPKQEKVKILRKNQADKTCRGDEICAGAPVLPEFEMTVKAIFAKPEPAE